MRSLMLVLLLLLLSPPVQAEAPPIIIFDQGQITVLRDKSKQLSLDDARAAHSGGQFKPLAANLALGYIPDAVWLHLSIAQKDPAERWLEVMPPYLDDIRVFHIRPGGQIDERRSGDRLPQSVKDEPYRGHLFKLDFQPGNHEIFIRLQTTSTMASIVKLWQPRAFEQHLRSSYFGYGLYFSLILSVMLFNAANWLVSRRVIFTVYIGYLLINGLQWLGTTGFIAEFLLPERPDLANLALGLSIPLGAGMAWLFFMMILELKRYHPFLYRFSQFGIAISFATFCASLLGYFQIFMPILLLVGTVSLFTVPWPAWRLWKKGEVWARMLALAYLLYALLLLINILSTLAMLPFNEWNIRAGMASNIAHILFLHFAILLHYRRIEIDHAEAIKKSALAERQLALEQAYNRKLAELSITDSLTGLANRRRLDEVLVSEYARSRRTGLSLTLVMVDLDYFKNYNDHYGHQAGDVCLKAIATVLEAHARRAGDLAARYGGEEFVIVLADTDIKTAQGIAEGVRQAIEANSVPHEMSPFGIVTVSLGLAVVESGSSMGADDLLRAADTALYRAKREGRNRVELAE